MNKWIDLNVRNNTIEPIYQHWILGKAKQKKEPRWSIKRDVLGWGLNETEQTKTIKETVKKKDIPKEKIDKRCFKEIIRSGFL